MSSPIDELTVASPRGAESETARETTRETWRDVLVLNRDPESRTVLHKALYLGDWSSTVVETSEEAMACVRRGSASLVVVTVDNPESVELIASIAAERPDVPILALTRAATPELVRDIMSSGAHDVIFGKLDARRIHDALGELGAKVRRAARDDGEPEAGASAAGGESASSSTPSAPSTSRSTASRSSTPPVEIICKNAKMRRVLEISKKVAPTDSTVLIQGESGTGKELIARWVHQHSQRSANTFVEVNCGALPENLLESQLFGHEKGSFTGAVHRQLGLFEVADGGTIFLDEIGEMSLDMQVKLLRVLQSREFRRIGGSQVVKVDVRVIAATNRDLKSDVEDGRFRTDLYYRLNVISLDLPPLRDRVEEIPDLVENFCEHFEKDRGLSRKVFTPEALRALQGYAWEGNIRELENAVERLVLLAAKDTVAVEDVQEHLVGQKRQIASESEFAADMSLDEVKRLHIAKVLKANEGNKMRSARVLEINVKTLYNLIKSLEITY